MTSYVTAELRRLIATRANGLCEYCLIHEDDTYFGCQVEHIVSEKHGGPTEAANLAYACVFCNRAKGTDLGTIVPSTGVLIRFFNPRRDRWNDHFALDGVRIKPQTEIGEATIRILRFNDPDRLDERESLERVGRYPPVGIS
jgi:hypothetical protein